MKRFVLQVDKDGSLIFPQHIKELAHFTPGSKLILEIDEDRMNLSRPADRLNRIYVEVTNRCNLDCSTCIRNTWENQLGLMPISGFIKLMEGIRQTSPPPEIFFGGYGEPLSHPDILEMIRLAKHAGHKSSLITNGTLLSPKMSAGVISAGLDMLWVSIDGARPESYQDIRLGNHLPKIIDNLETFRAIRSKKYGESIWGGRPELGIAFVIMKKNASELQEIIHLGERLGANQFYVTNLLAYSDEMASEILYEECFSHSSGRWEGTQPKIYLPRMDFDGQVGQEFMDLVMQGYPVKIAGNIINQNPYLCPFVARGATAVRWDGQVSPCLPLLYEHTSIYKNWKRRSVPFSFGNTFSSSLSDIWNKSEYRDFREHLLDMNFSPCVDCHACEMSEDNLLDCAGFRHPNCGGCLWAQGVIQCP